MRIKDKQARGEMSDVLSCSRLRAIRNSSQACSDADPIGVCRFGTSASAVIMWQLVDSQINLRHVGELETQSALTTPGSARATDSYSPQNAGLLHQ